MMSGYVYGASTMALLGVMVNVIDDNVPNSLWYYVDLYLPF